MNSGELVPKPVSRHLLGETSVNTSWARAAAGKTTDMEQWTAQPRSSR